jgi:triosephosphate isomerase
MAHAPPLRPLIAGNWKMNGSVAALAEALAVRDRLAEPDFGRRGRCDALSSRAAPASAGGGTGTGTPATWRPGLPRRAERGAHRDLSAELLKDVGASAVIVGHSERRAEHGESDQEVRRKVSAAHRAGLTAIVCLGETAGERRACLTLDVIGRQLARSLPEHVRAADTVIAYEPVWAIGSGLSAKPEDVAEVHGFLRQALTQRCGEEGARLRLLYGGSVKPDNAEQLLAIADVNGALVGGASLKAADFLGIVAACGA